MGWEGERKEEGGFCKMKMGNRCFQNRPLDCPQAGGCCCHMSFRHPIFGSVGPTDR